MDAGSGMFAEAKAGLAATDKIRIANVVRMKEVPLGRND